MIGIPPFPAHEKTALCLDRAVNSVGWQSIFSCFYMYPFVNRRKGMGIDKVLVTILLDNIASQAVAIANGGVVTERTDERVFIWIDTKK